MHFLLFKNNQLVGYNLLRKRLIFDTINNSRKTIFYFDTFIIDKSIERKDMQDIL